MDLAIINGILVTHEHIYNGIGIGIKNGKIVQIDKDEKLGPAEKVIDANNNYILPGIIDGHVHFREPGLSYKEDYFNGSMAAAFGGVTCIMDMPNTDPPLDNVEAFKEKEKLIQNRSFVDYGLIGLVTESNVDKIQELKHAGVVGFKCFIGQSEQGRACPFPPNDGILLDSLEEVSATGLTYAFHAENHEILLHKIKKLKENGVNNWEAHLLARPIVTEVESIQRVALFAQTTKTKIHICHISSYEGMEMVNNWAKLGVNISCETGAQYCFLSAEDMKHIGGVMKVNPPIREKVNNKKLLSALCEGKIHMIASDHAPHSIEEKIGSIDNIWGVNAGMIGVETTPRLFLSEAVNRGYMSINQFVKLTSYMPSLIWNINHQKGEIRLGYDADIIIVDLNKKWTIINEELHSKNKISAFHGKKGTGMPVTTIIRGKVVVEDGKLIGSPLGKRISPKKEFSREGV